MESGKSKPDRPVLINIIVMIVVTVSMLAVPIRKVFQERNDPERMAVVRGRVIAQAFDKIAITNHESAAGILRCADPALELSTLPGMPKVAGVPTIAWNVVDLPANAPREMPLLISRNVRANSPASLTGRVADAIIDEPPFGTNCVVIIFRSGGAATIQGDALQGTWMPYIGDRQLTNHVFSPVR